MSAVNVTVEETLELVTVAVTETVETVTVSVTAGVGATGAAATVAVGTTTTGEAGTDASVTETGDAQNKTFNFVIPRGAVGAAATVAVGTTTTGETGADASVTETGDAQNKTFDFLIPRGAVGAAATVAVGTTTTGEAGTDASVTETGTAQNKTFNFVIPRGADGSGGGGGKFVDGTNPDDAVYLAGRVGIGVALPVARQHIQGNDAAVVVQRVQGSAGQTANLAEWRNAGGKTLMEVSAEGVLNISGNNDLVRPTASIYVAPDVLAPTSNALYITSQGGRIFLGAVNEFTTLDLGHINAVQRAPPYVTGGIALGGTGNSHGMARIGNDVAIWTSATNGRLLHYTKPDGFGPRAVLRYVVLPNGNFGIGVEEPTEKLHVDGKIKASSINFTGLPTSAAGLETGDVWNDNGTLKIV